MANLENENDREIYKKKKLIDLANVKKQGQN